MSIIFHFPQSSIGESSAKLEVMALVFVIQLIAVSQSRSCRRGRMQCRGPELSSAYCERLHVIEELCNSRNMILLNIPTYCFTWSIIGQASTLLTYQNMDPPLPVKCLRPENISWVYNIEYEFKVISRLIYQPASY